MDKCPICGKVTQDNPDVCSACGTPLQTDGLALKKAEEAIDNGSSGGFGRFCLVLAMVASLLHCLIIVVGGIYLAILQPEAIFLCLLLVPLGFCLSVAQYIVFRKVHEIYDFSPKLNASNK